MSDEIAATGSAAAQDAASATAVSVAAAAQAVAIQVADASANAEGIMKKPKRLCRYPGCSRVIKSQGHCQRHGAKAKRCRIDGCEKQAQGTHDGMCKRHWKAIHFPEAAETKSESQPPQPKGESVYDSVLPQSIAYRPNNGNNKKEDEQVASAAAAPTAPAAAAPTAAALAATGIAGLLTTDKDGNTVDPWDCPPPPEGVNVMPLITYFRSGSGKEPGWHRNSERRARGMFFVNSQSAQLEPWERQLALVEILLLSGGTPYANFKDLAHAWGREKGFHHILANSICERRGAVERKRRSDAGKRLTAQERQDFKQKLKRARTNEEGEEGEGGGGSGSDQGDGNGAAAAPHHTETEV